MESGGIELRVLLSGGDGGGAASSVEGGALHGLRDPREFS